MNATNECSRKDRLIVVESLLLTVKNSAMRIPTGKNQIFYFNKPLTFSAFGADLRTIMSDQRTFISYSISDI